MESITSTLLDISASLRPATTTVMCRQHPDFALADCYGCKAEERSRQDRIIAEMKADALTEAERRMTERFPARYRDARADITAVVEWTELFGEQAETPNPGLLLLGATGVGKTWQAYGALRAIVSNPVRNRAGYRPRSFQAMTYADMCASLRPRPKVDTEEVMKAMRTTEILLIDDLAAAKGSDWVEEVTYRLINGRYEDMKPTIFTTNLTVPQLRDSIGDRIASRLAENCTRVALKGDDRRRAPKEA